MFKRQILKITVLLSLFFTVFYISFYSLTLLAPTVNIANLTEQTKYVLALFAALLSIVITTFLGRQLYNYIRHVIISLSVSDFIIGIISAIIGLIMGALASVPLAGLPDPWSWIISIVVVLITTFLAVWAFNLKKTTIIEWFSSLPLLNQTKLTEPLSVKHSIIKSELEQDYVNPMLLDTSAIIDGRVAEIIKSGFLFGTLLLPHFILEELQQVADSNNTEKRQRGRKGLKLLQSIRRGRKIVVKTIESDYPQIEQVDAKLVQLAKDLNAKIITCDFNLNSVAKVHGIAILNVNELANYLKERYLPGEEISINVVQTGKEDGQGIGYLSDGTMVVVQGGSKYIGKEIATTVERVLQTEAGRMIFTKRKLPNLS